MKTRIILSALLALSFVTASKASAKEFNCPKVVKVDVADLKSTPATDAQAIVKIFEAGDKQTELGFIEAVLNSANAISNFSDELTIVKARSNDEMCVYWGKDSTLVLTPKTYSKVAQAVLSIGYVKYVSASHGSPTEARGYESQLVTPLKKMSATEIAAFRTKKSVLELELGVQIPIGDFGTDGFLERVNIGSAESVTYTFVK